MGKSFTANGTKIYRFSAFDTGVAFFEFIYR